jgi:pyruvate ferredoxin oxidoreductase gamma subunit
MLVNSAKSFPDLGLRPSWASGVVAGFHPGRLLVVPASSLAITHLGRPLPGAAMLGGFAALTGAVGLDGVVAAINERFSGKVADGNVTAARAAYAYVLAEREALTTHA